MITTFTDTRSAPQAMTIAWKPTCSYALGRIAAFNRPSVLAGRYAP
jgi:hypothetical protein